MNNGKTKIQLLENFDKKILLLCDRQYSYL